MIPRARTRRLPALAFFSQPLATLMCMMKVKKMRRIRPFARSLRVAPAESPRAAARASLRFVRSPSRRASRDVTSLPPSRAPSRRSSTRDFSRFVRASGRDVCKVKGPSAGGGVSGQARASLTGTSVALGAAPVIPTRPVPLGARSRKGGRQTNNLPFAGTESARPGARFRRGADGARVDPPRRERRPSRRTATRVPLDAHMSPPPA